MFRQRHPSARDGESVSLPAPRSKRRGPGARGPRGKRAALWSATLTLLLLPALLAVVLGSAVWLRARRDLVRMSRGEVDPGGMGQTASARGLAGAVVVGTLLQF